MVVGREGAGGGQGGGGMGVGERAARSEDSLASGPIRHQPALRRPLRLGHLQCSSRVLLALQSGPPSLLCLCYRLLCALYSEALPPTKTYASCVIVISIHIDHPGRVDQFKQ